MVHSASLFALRTCSAVSPAARYDLYELPVCAFYSARLRCTAPSLPRTLLSLFIHTGAPMKNESAMASHTARSLASHLTADAEATSMYT